MNGGILLKLAQMPCSNNIRSVVRKFVLSTCVYFIWRERNVRIFTSEKKDANRLSKEIEESVRVQLMNIKFSGTIAERKCSLGTMDIHRVLGWIWKNSLNGDAIVRNELALSDTDFV
ncbi:hypothetical protein Tco_0728276 [Tanacetum coccineum]|uniref:Reverse transcriptase zinc-binding domain-containing protein n=1 Tax=Tanacetum coccineum TaxID=301880 RepID=A0ABQ4YLJ6_9ASTR